MEKVALGRRARSWRYGVMASTIRSASGIVLSASSCIILANGYGGGRAG